MYKLTSEASEESDSAARCSKIKQEEQEDQMSKRILTDVEAHLDNPSFLIGFAKFIFDPIFCLQVTYKADSWVKAVDALSGLAYTSGF